MKWFSSYLFNRKQFIEYEKRNIKIDFLDIICGVPQGLIFWTLVFIISVSQICFSYKHMTDDTNIFCSDRNIKNLFQNAYDELCEFNKISEWSH